MPSNPPPISLPVVPPLENGDKLTRYEFEQRLEAMPANTQAERIEGIVMYLNFRQELSSRAP